MHFWVLILKLRLAAVQELPQGRLLTYRHLQGSEVVGDIAAAPRPASRPQGHGCTRLPAAAILGPSVSAPSPRWQHTPKGAQGALESDQCCKTTLWTGRERFEGHRLLSDWAVGWRRNENVGQVMYVFKLTFLFLLKTCCCLSRNAKTNSQVFF